MASREDPIDCISPEKKNGEKIVTSGGKKEVIWAENKSNPQKNQDEPGNENVIVIEDSPVKVLGKGGIAVKATSSRIDAACQTDLEWEDQKNETKKRKVEEEYDDDDGYDEEVQFIKHVKYNKEENHSAPLTVETLQRHDQLFPGPAPVNADHGLCPMCGGRISARTAYTVANKGRKFYACPTKSCFFRWNL